MAMIPAIPSGPHSYHEIAGPGILGLRKAFGYVAPRKYLALPVDPLFRETERKDCQLETAPPTL